MPVVLAGTKLEISEQLPQTLDKTGFEALTYTQIKGVRIISDLGKKYATATYQVFGMKNPINKRYGVESHSINLELIRIKDAGQAIIRGAEKVCSYRLTEPDGETSYFTAEASQVLKGVGDPKTVSDIKILLQIHSQI